MDFNQLNPLNYWPWWTPAVQPASAQPGSAPAQVDYSRELEAKLWAWYQPATATITTETADGQLSILSTQTESQPVQLPTYPANSDPTPHSAAPTVTSNFRTSTFKTRCRLAFGKYYAFDWERHLYVKPQGLNSIDINSTLLISLSNDPNIPQFQGRFIHVRVPTSSLSNDALLEDIFKLIINWRHMFPSITHLLVVGNTQCSELAIQLLDILTQRRQFPGLKRKGLMLTNPVVSRPNTTIKPATSTTLQTVTLSWYDLLDLLLQQGARLTVISSPAALPSMLELQHPNIHRMVAFPKTIESTSPESTTPSYSWFQQQLLTMLLIVLNINKDDALIQLSKRLILQLVKYIHTEPAISLLSEAVISETLVHQFATTTLIQPQQLHTLHIAGVPHYTSTTRTKRPIASSPPTGTFNSFKYLPKHNGSQVASNHTGAHVSKMGEASELLDNKYNLIWNIHAFLDAFGMIPNIDTSKEINKLLSLFRTWDMKVNPLPVNNIPCNGTKTDTHSTDPMDLTTSSKTNGSAKTSPEPRPSSAVINALKPGSSKKPETKHMDLKKKAEVNADERELCLMLEVLKMEEYCHCLRISGHHG